MFSSISRKIEKKHLFLVGFKLYYNQDTKGQNYSLNIEWNSILLVETAIKNNWTYVVEIFMSFIFQIVEILIRNEIVWFKNWFKFHDNWYIVYPTEYVKTFRIFLKFQVNYIGSSNLSNRFLKYWFSVEYSIENENWNENESDWEFILKMKIGRRILNLSVWRCVPLKMS